MKALNLRNSSREKVCPYRCDLPWEGHRCLCGPHWGPIGVFSRLLRRGRYVCLLIRRRRVLRLRVRLRLRLSLRRRWGLYLRPWRRLSVGRPGSRLARPRFGGYVCKMRLRWEVFELGFGRQITQLRFGREVRELRLRRKISRFGGELRHLRLWGKVSWLRPLHQRNLLPSLSWRRRLLEDLWRKAGLIHRRMVYGVNLTQCHWRGNHIVAR